jgi:hypothetical protein
MGDGGIAAPASHAAARIDTDNVARSEHAAARDPMHHLVIDGDAAGRGERHFPRHTLEQRNRVVLCEEAIDRLVNLPRGHSWLDQRSGHLVSSPDHKTSPPHQGYFTSRTKIHHASRTHKQETGKHLVNAMATMLSGLAFQTTVHAKRPWIPRG